MRQKYHARKTPVHSQTCAISFSTKTSFVPKAERNLVHLPSPCLDYLEKLEINSDPNRKHLHTRFGPMGQLECKILLSEIIRITYDETNLFA